MDAKHIRIDTIHISRTYAGVLELPSTDQTIDRARKLAKRICGERPTLLVPPATKKLERPPRWPVGAKYAIERYPEWLIVAWLNAPAMKSDNHGSELVVIWFQNEIPYEIPGELLHDFSCGTWEKHATDFCF